jgi:hypothetical protein
VSLATSTRQPQVSGGIDPGLLKRALRPVLTAALEQLGDIEVAFIQTTLRKPVEVGAGGKLIRSAPGEYPRMDEAVLLRNVRHAVSEGETGLPELLISVSRPPSGPGDQANAAEILEYGGFNQQGRRVEPRPFMAGFFGAS